MTNLTAQSVLADRCVDTDAAVWENGALTLKEIPFLGMVKLQQIIKNTAFAEAVVKANLSLPLPGCVNDNGHTRCLWLTPNEWLFVVPAGSETVLVQQLHSQFNDVALVTDITDSRVAIAITGECAQGVLAKGSAVDWHPEQFVIGQCTVTRFAQVAVMVHRVDDESYELYVDRAFGVYLWDWLVDAASEFV